MTLPTLSSVERQKALDKAAAARRARSELLDQVRTGALTVHEVLQRADTDEIVKRTKVTALLKALPRYGPARVNELLERTQIPDNRRIGGLGQRQRQALLAALS